MNRKKPKSNTSFLSGGGEMGELIRQKDWGNSPVGPPEKWSQSLRTTLSIILHSKFPMFLFWGPELICFYNDAYRPSLGNNGKHPDLLGGRAEDYWSETWTRIKPNIDQVLAGDEAIWREDQLYSMNINGKMEDVYWTFCYSAVYDESGSPAGILVTCAETTKQVTSIKHLKESEDQLKFTIAAAEMATWDIDPVTNTIKANDRWKEWFGLGYGGEVNVSQALDRIVEHDRQKVIDAMQAALQPGSDGNFEVEHTLINPLNNRERIIRAKGKALFNVDNIAYRFSGTAQDITEQVNALKKMEESEAQLRLALEGGDLGHFDSYPLTGQMNWSPKAKTFLGVPLDTEVNLELYIKVIHPDDLEKAATAMMNALKGESNGIYENEFRTISLVDGKTRWLHIRGNVKFNADGVAHRISGVVQDITQSKQSEQIVKESEERFHTLADNMSQFAWMADETTGIYWYNQRWYDYSGTTLEDMKGLGWQKLHHPDHLERVIKSKQHSWNLGEIWEDTFPLKGKDGQYRWFLSRAIPIKEANGKVVRWFGTNTDVTEQNGLIEKLNETVDKLNLYEKVVVNIKEAVMITEAEPFELPGPRIVYVNEAFYNITGYTPEEVIGKTPRILQGPNTDRHQLDKIRKALQNWQPTRVELINYKKDGTEFYVEFEIVPVANEKGRFTHWVSVQRDVTEGRIVEKKIRESEQLLRKTKEQLELTFANVPAAIFLYNHKKEILFANEKAAHLLGYNTVEELLKEQYYDLLMQKAGENYYVKDEHDEPFLSGNLPSVNALKIGQSGEVVFSMEKRAGGKKVWLLNKSAPILDENGEVSMVLTTSTDITAQKTAEQKIRDSENRFRQLAEDSPMFVWIADEGAQVTYANTESLNYIGIKHYSELTGHKWEQIVHPQDIQLVYETFNQAFLGIKPYAVECRIKNIIDETYQWFYIKGNPRFEENKFVGFIGTGFNINEQKTHLEKLQESEENFRQLSNLMPEKILRSDADGNVIYYNKSWLDYTGLSYEALKNWGWAQTIHPDDIEELTRMWTHSLMTGNRFEMEFRILNTAGQYRWHLSRSSTIKDAEGTIKNWIAVTTDIEQQKSFTRELEQQVRVRTNELKTVNKMLLQKNELLTASENFNRSLTEVSPTMVYIHGIETNKPIFLNNTYLNFVGYDWAKVVELDNNFISSVIHPDDLAFCNEILQKVIKSKEGEVFEGNFRRKNAYGAWVPFLNRLTAFQRNDKNKVTQIIGVAIDISDLKKAENFLRQKNLDLENMNKELQSFAYISSHDLQEPLRKIQTFANRIAEKEYNNLSNTGKDYFKRMEEAASRMRTLIDDLLAYSRTSMQERKLEKTHLADIVEEIRLEFAEEFSKKQAVLEAENLCACNVIPFQMRQLLHNLISNALKFAHSNHPPHITIKSEIAKGAKLPNPQLESEKEYCHIRISDNGIGFEQQYSEKIFEVFQRLHGKQEYRGTGIGLSIVKKIVDNHYGIITAKGEVGKGATFDVYIPAN
jgi:PAS domain S-box-containing protein